MTDQEALRVAWACMIDVYRSLPEASKHRPELRVRVGMAIRTLAEIVEGKRTFKEEHKP